MPELPEVEVTRRGLLSALPGRRVTHVAWSGKRLRAPVPRVLLSRHILGDRFAAIGRRGKYLLFRMENGSVLLIHLGMTGKLTLIPACEPTAVHDHLRLQLDNGRELRFNDSRRFGGVTVWPAAEARQREQDLSGRLGVEPLGTLFTARYLQQRSRSKKQAVKNFLMDAGMIAGIGNIYANEILFAAAIHPLIPVCGISADEWKRIVRSTRLILNRAIRAGGSTISDFRGASGNPGYFQLQFMVYGRAGNLCRRCGVTIVKCIAAGRATFFCPVCQPAANPIHPTNIPRGG